MSHPADPLHAGPRAAGPGSAAPGDPRTPDGLAALLRGLPPSCGPVRLVGVDGHAGSGKSTFAARLAARLGDSPVLHLDDLASHEAFFGWPERLERQVLAPLSGGGSARYEVYDWERRAFGGERALPPAPVVLVEGVGAGRRAVRPALACLVWMDMPPGRAWERGLRRDGAQLQSFWDDWTRAERTHFADDPSYPYANFVVRECSEGYEVLQGPLRLR